MLGDLIRALKAGQQLRDPARWKRGQQLTNAVGALVLAVIGVIRWQFPDVNMPAELAEEITQIIVTVLVIINLYLTPATSRKIGVK